MKKTISLIAVSILTFLFVGSASGQGIIYTVSGTIAFGTVTGTPETITACTTQAVPVPGSSVGYGGIQSFSTTGEVPSELVTAISSTRGPYGGPMSGFPLCLQITATDGCATPTMSIPINGTVTYVFSALGTNNYLHAVFTVSGIADFPACPPPPSCPTSSLSYPDLGPYISSGELRAIPWLS